MTKRAEPPLRKTCHWISEMVRLMPRAIARSWDTVMTRSPFSRWRQAPTCSEPHVQRQRQHRGHGQGGRRSRWRSFSAAAISSSAPSPPRARPPLTKDLAWGIPMVLPMPRGSARNSPTATMRSPGSRSRPAPARPPVAYGNAKGRLEAEVKAGETQEVVVLLGSGKVKLSVVMEEGGTPVSKDVSWDVFVSLMQKETAPRPPTAMTPSRPSRCRAGKFLRTSAGGKCQRHRRD